MVETPSNEAHPISDESAIIMQRFRDLPRLKTKAEWVGVVWAEFVTTSNIWDDTSKEN